jgi:L,D-peptidoglycan transpeptidase YkuD (ErfK/YbiS/YcfS/YnhG family)
LVIVVGYNDDPVVPHKGSAIFIHLKPESGFTQGCIGIHPDNLMRIVSEASPKTNLVVLP